MKFRFLRQAGALLLTLALVCSLLVLPAAAAASIIGGDFELNVGGTKQLTVQDMDGDITWRILDRDRHIASVSSTGLVTALAPGSAVIFAMDIKNTIVQCTVTVKEVPVPATGIQLSERFLEATEGDPSVRLTATVTPSNSTDTVSFESSNPSVVSVDQQGNLNFLKAGDAQITAAAGTAEAYCQVFVAARPLASSVTVTPDSLNLPQGGTATLTAKVEGKGAAEGVEWLSDEHTRNYVSVSSSGKVTVSRNAPIGTQATIWARAVVDPTVDDICVVTVIGPKTPEVSAVDITTPATNEGKNYVDVGGTLELKAVASPADADPLDREITWSSSDTSVATVNPKTGVVRGVSPGEASITAQSNGSDPKTATRDIEVSGLLLSYIKKSTSGSKGETISLTEKSVVDIYQYRDITVSAQAYGNARNKIIGWDSSNNSVAQALSGRVSAHYPGESTITATAEGTSCQASFKVRVSEDVAQAVTVNMGSEPSYSFSGILSVLDRRSQDKAGGPLDCVYSLKVSTENGVLYYKYVSPETPGHGVGGTERYYYQPMGGQMALKDVTFVPLPGFDGTAIVEYNALSTAGITFSGTIRIEATATGDVTYSANIDQPVSFSAEHFSAICKGRTGRAIGYVTFGLPASSRGTLYYNYSPSGQYSAKVTSSTRYYATSSPSIDNITFVPAKGYTGDVDIPYRCTDSAGASFSGVIRIRVYSSTGGQGGGNLLEYSTGRNQRIILSASDFNNACQQAVNGTLNYIRFTSLPSSSVGTLYLNYNSSSSTKVVAGRNYYRNASPRISNITFVPATNYSGTVTISFTGTSDSGITFSSDLVIHVDDGRGTVHYNTPRNQYVTFDSGDFASACRSITGGMLDRIRFTSLPSSSAGVLYYNYYSSSNSRITTGTDYYRSSSPSISSITLVPAAGYVGTLTIPFTAYDTDRVRFNGTLTISVGGGASQIVSYSAAANGFVRFNASDFNSACRSATGDTLNYVRFDLPASLYGTLYHQYNSVSRTGNVVTSGTGYYYSGNTRLIGDVSFVPASSASGTITFGYTGYSTRGDSFSGTVEITIAGFTSSGSLIRYTGSSAHPILFRAADFQNACQAALGTQLSYVQFGTLPYTGHLYQNYSGPARTGTGVTTAAHYSSQQLTQISYVPKAEFQGVLTIPYTAYDTQGGSHSSSVELQLSNAYCYATFADTASGWDWAMPSIEFLRSSGITNGYSNNTYRPGRPISRGEFTLMICRAFQFSTSGSSGFPDVPANSTYAGAVAAARELGIVQGNNGRFQPDRPITRQSAMTMIFRALEATGQSLPVVDAGLLASYTDGHQVSAFARPAVAALVQMGVVRGNSSSRLNPGTAISRAEMAVILHRVLTR